MTQLELLDWRRRVADLYGEVRVVRADNPFAAHAAWRAGRDALFAAHPQSPLERDARAAFRGLGVWPYDPAAAAEVPVDTDVEPTRLDLPMSSGGAHGATRIGVAATPFGALDVYWLDGYGGGVFVPFRDATAGSTTYGGGRYLLDTVKGADLGSTLAGALVLDFNFAYHPSCAYDDKWSCPLAPPGSRLAAPVEAGERL